MSCCDCWNGGQVVKRHRNRESGRETSVDSGVREARPRRTRYRRVAGSCRDRSSISVCKRRRTSCFSSSAPEARVPGSIPSNTRSFGQPSCFRRLRRACTSWGLPEQTLCVIPPQKSRSPPSALMISFASSNMKAVAVRQRRGKRRALRNRRRQVLITAGTARIDRPVEVSARMKHGRHDECRRLKVVHLVRYLRWSQTTATLVRDRLSGVGIPLDKI